MIHGIKISYTTENKEIKTMKSQTTDAGGFVQLVYFYYFMVIIGYMLLACD